MQLRYSLSRRFMSAVVFDGALAYMTIRFVWALCWTTLGCANQLAD